MDIQKVKSSGTEREAFRYFRNTIDIHTLFGLIEADSLWYRQENPDNDQVVMVLDDEDQFAEVPFHPNQFREVSNPYEDGTRTNIS